MKACEIMEELFALAPQGQKLERTCDTLKAGDPEKEVRRVATSMFATPEVVRAAHAWGADLLIVHEPTYYNHWDDHGNDPQELEKRSLIQSTGMALYRYHDHPHLASPDMIAMGELKASLPEAAGAPPTAFGKTDITLERPTTPRALARLLEEKLGIAHIRIAGAADAPCRRVACYFGSPGDVLELLAREETEIVLVGETCEWRDLEYARDAAQLGRRKAVLVMGHVGSEREGMAYTAEKLREMHPELEVRYFDCGEVYTYTDR